MAIGVPETDVFQAADQVLARGMRPTVERVRAELGRGSPARVGQLLEQWWDVLAKRLAGETQLPDLPADVASAFKSLWTAASEQATALADRRLSEVRDALAAEQAALSAQRTQWAADLETGRNETAHAREAQTAAEQRLADLQRLLEHVQTQLRDVNAQRDKLQEHAELLAHDLVRLGDKLEVQDKAHAAERAAAAAHVRSVEDRAHAEVDRVRGELKALRKQVTDLEHETRTLRQAAADETRQHMAALGAAEKYAATHVARSAALEEQLARLSVVKHAKSPAKTAGSRAAILKKLKRFRGKLPADTGFDRDATNERTSKKTPELLAHMQTPEHRAGVDALFAATPQNLLAAVKAGRRPRKPK